MSYNTQNYKEQGGARDVIAGELLVAAGGKLNVDQAAVFVGMPRIRQFKWTAAEAVAADDDFIKTAVLLTGSAQANVAAVKTLPCARCVTITGSQAGQNNVVKVYGADNDGAAISEELTLANNALVVGAKAFKSITKVDLPAWDTAAAYQTEDITFTAACGVNGDCKLKIEDTVLTGAAAVELTLAATTTAHGTVGAVAQAFADLINADETLSAKYTASVDAGKLIITANAYAANDTALAFTLTAGDTEVAASGGSHNGTAGAAQLDSVKIGFGDKLGLPILLANGALHLASYLNNVLESTAAAITTSGTVLSSNTIDLPSALNGTVVEAVFLER